MILNKVYEENGWTHLYVKNPYNNVGEWHTPTTNVSEKEEDSFSWRNSSLVVSKPSDMKVFKIGHPFGHNDILFNTLEEAVAYVEMMQ